MNFLQKIGLLFLSAAIFAQPAEAHPHVWVTYTLKAVSGKQGLSRIDFTWRFDAMFSEMALEAAGLKKVSAGDSKTLEEKAFSNLKNYHYYTYITADGVEFKPETVHNFSAEMKGKNLVYHFSIALPKPAKKLEIAIWDDEFYVDLDPPTEEVPNDKAGSFMSERKFAAKPFVGAESENGAKPPACTQREKDHVSEIWGKFITYIVECQAN
ncbi:MAG TPA: DUF1007 family protein [Alphaproteobacteria bacterium]|nr:DUF1007 family protein [Alphaproteobacteria bacterium]